MLKIKRTYLRKTKEILKEIKKNYSYISEIKFIFNIDKSISIICYNNKKEILTFWICNNNYFFEISESLYNNTNKKISIDFQNYLNELIENSIKNI